MEPSKERGLTFWSVQIPGWMLLVYLMVAQGLSAIDYDLGVAMGTQESSEYITEVGAAFWYGFAFGDLLIYIPLLLAGLVGHVRRARWGRVVLTAAMGITIYWPIVCLAALVDARGAPGWDIAGEAPYWIVCTAIAAYGAWGLVAMVRGARPSA